MKSGERTGSKKKEAPSCRLLEMRLFYSGCVCVCAYGFLSIALMDVAFYGSQHTYHSENDFRVLSCFLHSGRRHIFELHITAFGWMAFRHQIPRVCLWCVYGGGRITIRAWFSFGVHLLRFSFASCSTPPLRTFYYLFMLLLAIQKHIVHSVYRLYVCRCVVPYSVCQVEKEWLFAITLNGNGYHFVS